VILTGEGVVEDDETSFAEDAGESCDDEIADELVCATEDEDL
jgi:hypothetical protein